MRKLLFIAALCIAFSSRADSGLRVVEGQYTYVVPKNMSIAQAESAAIDYAILDALAGEFGTLVQAETQYELHETNGESVSDFWRLGTNLVKGEWIETIGEPKITRSLHNDGSMVIYVHIKGRAMPINSNPIDLTVKPMRMSKDGVFESQRFVSGDGLELDFAAAVDGFLSVFLADDAGNVFNILPFANEKDGATAIKGGKNYRFFHDNTSAAHEKYRLTTDSDLEHNILYVVFSPAKYTKPFGEMYANMRRLKRDDFNKWLTRLRITDPDLQLRTIPITIIK